MRASWTDSEKIGHSRMAPIVTASGRPAGKISGPLAHPAGLRRLRGEGPAGHPGADEGPGGCRPAPHLDRPAGNRSTAVQRFLKTLLGECPKPTPARSARRTRSRRVAPTLESMEA